MSNITRRGLLKGAASVGAAAAGSRLILPSTASAQLAETSHFVHIFFHGGINALFTGNAQELRGQFGVNDGNILAVGNGVTTDRATLGTLPQFALDHWAALGFRHGSSDHTVPENPNAGGEMFCIRNNQTGGLYLNELAAAMKSGPTFQSVLFGIRSGNYGAFRTNWPAVDGVSLQRITNLRDALSAVGADLPNDPNAPNRELLAKSLEAGHHISDRQIATNPGRLTPFVEAYDAAINTLRQPLPPPVTFDEVNQAYGLNGNAAIGRGSYAQMLAGAEIMIRAANTSVIHISDFEPMWDFDANVNGPRSRNAFVGSHPGWGGHNRVAAIRTFMNRMLNYPGKNVVVAISGEFVRRTTGHGHGDGTVAAVFGKHVRQGKLHPVNNQARFNNAPGTREFWAGIADALRVPGKPFGNNPYASLTGA